MQTSGVFLDSATATSTSVTPVAAVSAPPVPGEAAAAAEQSEAQHQNDNGYRDQKHHDFKPSGTPKILQHCQPVQPRRTA